MNDDGKIYERVLSEDPRGFQIRLTISEFLEVEYLHIRKYYMDFEGEWLPTKEGISFPVDFDNVKELFIALVQILSLAESKQVLFENFNELLEHLQTR